MMMINNPETQNTATKNTKPQLYKEWRDKDNEHEVLEDLLSKNTKPMVLYQQMIDRFRLAKSFDHEPRPQSDSDLRKAVRLLLITLC